MFQSIDRDQLSFFQYIESYKIVQKSRNKLPFKCEKCNCCLIKLVSRIKHTLSIYPALCISVIHWCIRSFNIQTLPFLTTYYEQGTMLGPGGATESGRTPHLLGARTGVGRNGCGGDSTRQIFKCLLTFPSLWGRVTSSVQGTVTRVVHVTAKAAMSWCDCSSSAYPCSDDLRSHTCQTAQL